jgi:subfamily B ATP-binding cassette protein HlyB/CyaB
VLVGQAIERESFVWAVGSLCALHRIPFDAELLLRRFPPPYTIASLQQAAIAYDFKVALESISVQTIHPTVFPVLAVLKPNSFKNIVVESSSTDASALESTEEAPNHHLAIVLKADHERVLLIRPEDAAPITISIAEYNELATGEIMLATKQAEGLSEDGLVGKPNNTNQAQQPFGFKWFIPELLKHKKLWREILLASFAIQIVALATPLGTQVIIDKVVVAPHHQYTDSDCRGLGYLPYF